MYTKNNYLEDCYIFNNSKGILKKNAKIRKKCYEKGRFDLIYRCFPEYRESDYEIETKKSLKHKLLNSIQSLTNSALIIIITSLIFTITCFIAISFLYSIFQ